jgi:hypothetical protein
MGRDHEKFLRDWLLSARIYKDDAWIQEHLPLLESIQFLLDEVKELKRQASDHRFEDL